MSNIRKPKRNSYRVNGSFLPFEDFSVRPNEYSDPEKDVLRTILVTNVRFMPSQVDGVFLTLDSGRWTGGGMVVRIPLDSESGTDGETKARGLARRLGLTDISQMKDKAYLMVYNSANPTSPMGIYLSEGERERIANSNAPVV